MSTQTKDDTVNVSDVIRGHFAKHPDVSVDKVMAWLNKRGLNCSKSLIHSIRTKVQGPRSRRQQPAYSSDFNPQPIVDFAVFAGTHGGLTGVREILAYVKDHGGIESVEKVLDLMEAARGNQL
jgi:hypothetical protein